MKSFAPLALLALSACASKPIVPVCPQLPKPEAWILTPAPDLMQELNGIITPYEIKSPE